MLFLNIEEQNRYPPKRFVSMDYGYGLGNDGDLAILATFITRGDHSRITSILCVFEK